MKRIPLKLAFRKTDPVSQIQLIDVWHFYTKLPHDCLLSDETTQYIRRRKSETQKPRKKQKQGVSHA